MEQATVGTDEKIPGKFTHILYMYMYIQIPYPFVVPSSLFIGIPSHHYSTFELAFVAFVASTYSSFCHTCTCDTKTPSAVPSCTNVCIYRVHVSHKHLPHSHTLSINLLTHNFMVNVRNRPFLQSTQEQSLS